MATKYDRVNPWEEKLKRLMNCSRLTDQDQKYFNYQYEKYALRSMQIKGAAFTSAVLFMLFPFVSNSSKFKYYTSGMAVGLGLY